MALTLLAMQTEVYARGFDFLNDGAAGTTRVTRWLNEAAHEIDETEDWIYRFGSVTGVAPLTVADLGQVESVVDVANLNPLTAMDRRTLTDLYPDTTLQGFASYWYLTAPTVIAVYPVTTATLTVRYEKFAPDMAAAGDAPLMPDRFRQIIVELAVAKALRDSNNMFSSADSMQEVQRLLGVMRGALLLDAESQQIVAGANDW